MQSKYKGIIFDLDGVLIDTKHIHRDAFIQAFLTYNNYLIDAAWHDRILCGMNSRSKLKILRQGNIPFFCQDEDILNLKDQLCQEQMRSLTGSLQKKLLLTSLQKSNMLLGCFTNCRRINADQILDQIGLKKYFDITVASDEVDNAKPDPEGYNKIIATWKIQPCETLIIEDSPHGVKAAQASGADLWIVQNADEVTLENIQKYL